MSISCAVLMCHAKVGCLPLDGLDEIDHEETARAMREAARALVAHEPQLIVLVSPHAPRHPLSWGIVSSGELRGNLPKSQYKSQQQRRLCFRGSPLAAATITQFARNYGLSMRDLPGAPLEEGALLPLSFVQEAGYCGPVIVVTPPLPGSQTEVLFGEVLREAALSLNEHWAVLASGDMGQPLNLDARLDDELRATAFGETFVELVRAGDLRGAIGINAALANTAAEDVIQSTAVAAGAIAFRSSGRKVFSYDSPFGMDSLEAMLYSDRAEINHRAPPSELLEIARRAIECELRGKPYLTPALEAPWQDPRPVYVTLRNERGELRGAVGRIEPIHATLAEEVADCATAATTRDYRMQPVELEEIPQLTLEVCILGDLETVRHSSDLDPRKFGVVVSRGLRRSMLMPNTEGVSSAAEQVHLALQKAGISPSERYRLERFSVSKASARLRDAIAPTLPWLD